MCEDEDGFLDDLDDEESPEEMRALTQGGYPHLQDPNSPTSQPEEDARISAVLEALHVSATQENRAQMGVYLQAFGVFLERNKRHKAGWRVAGVMGILVDIRKKTERLWTEFVLGDTPPDDVDSAVDLINYTAFFVQAVGEEKSGRTVGTWQWPSRNRQE